MGDSTCLMQGFSYASAIPNESKQGNPVHALGESVSFGRFMTESLSWEKWSTFSHKKYVEEAERYAQPGSVAQKKAFFEAHYKRIAEQKAAALLEQENIKAAKNVGETKIEVQNYDQEQILLIPRVNVDQEKEIISVPVANEGSLDAVEIGEEVEKAVIVENEASGEVPVINKICNLENQDAISGSESSGTPLMERPLLKSSVAIEDPPSVSSKKKSSLSSLKSSIQRKTWRIPSTPVKPIPQLKKENDSVTQSTRKSNVESKDEKKYSPKSLRSLINLIPSKDQAKNSVIKKKTESSSMFGFSSLRTPKDCATPLKTPSTATSKGVSKYPIATPCSDSRRVKESIDPSASVSKTSGPKWHILSAVCSKSITACRNKLQSPTISTPFLLRTEERAAKRKQKLEEKFNAKEVQKVQVQKTLKEKAGNEFKKLGRSLCFKARPLPDFYKEREAPKNPIKKAPTKQPQSTVVLGRSISSKTTLKGGNTSMPPPPPPPMSFAKNGAPKNVSKKKMPNKNKLPAASLPERMTFENKSPNIQL